MQGNISTVIFYLGTFITSFGSLLFVMSIPAFFISNGISKEIIGVTIAAHRFSGIIASAWFGPVIDRWNSRNVIFYTEFFAAASSIGLVFSWLSRDELSLYPFMIFVGTRALILGVQSSSRNRLVKLLSSDSQTAEASFVIWLNKVTQGAHLISSLAAISLVATGNLVVAIIIDAISFLIGGISALQLPNIDSSTNRALTTHSNFIKSLISLFKRHRFVFIQDQLLALTVSGTILLMVKLSDENPQEVIYFNLLFGACIWLSSIFAHKKVLRDKNKTYWTLILIGFISLTLTYNSSFKFISYLITYMGYWILYHKYTVEIQTGTPKESIGSTMAARGLAVTITLSVGELFGGFVSRLFEVKTELIIRASLAVIALMFVAIYRKNLRKKKEVL